MIDYGKTWSFPAVNSLPILARWSRSPVASLFLEPRGGVQQQQAQGGGGGLVLRNVQEPPPRLAVI